MYRPFALFVGLRYTRSRRRNRFISFISLISVLGTAIGVTALITVLSVMNGFEHELRDRILGMAAHITIRGAAGGEVADWRSVAGTARGEPGVRAAAPFVQAESMLTANGRVSGAMINGVDPATEAEVSEVGSKMKAGHLDDLAPGEYGIILGKELAWQLGVVPGDPVTVITPQVLASAVGALPRLRRFTVVGIFEVGMYEYDRGVALIDLDDARRLYRMDGVSGVRLKVEDLFATQALMQRLAGDLPPGLRLTDWTHQHANFFTAVKTEKRVMFVILTLIVAVAAFNIVSTLVMAVTDKAADIAILRTLGATPGSIMRVFIIQGALIGLIGTVLGIVGGVALALNVETIVPAIEHAFGVQFLPADVYYISELPSELKAGDVWHIGGIAFVLSLLATLYPAWRAGRVQPAEALRYE